MTIHVIGDSHSRLFWEIPQSDNLQVHWLGPKTMWCIGHSTFDSFCSLREWIDQSGRTREADWIKTIVPGDTILWVLGEIDVRCHLVKQVTENGSWVIADLVRAFLAQALEVQNSTGTRGMVLSVTPAMDSGNALFPCVGTLAQRRAITLELNRELHSKCGGWGIKFCSVWDIVADDDGGIKSEYNIDSCHVGGKSVAAQVLCRVWENRQCF